MHHELSVYIWILLIIGVKFILSVLQIQKLLLFQVVKHLQSEKQAKCH